MANIDVVLAFLLTVVTANSTNYFLRMRKARVAEWIFFNACAPSSLCFLLGFATFWATGNRVVMHAATIPMLFFGGIGLYVFEWRGPSLFAQVGHIVMTANVLRNVVSTWAAAVDFESAFLGMLLGSVVFLPFICLQQLYVYAHPKAFRRLLDASPDAFLARCFISREDDGKPE